MRQPFTESVPEPVDPGAPSIVTSWLRTVVPGAWAALITTVLTAWPWLAGVLERINVDLSSPAVATVVVALVLAAWYAAWRKIEPLLPDWAKRLVLGGAKSPTYAPVSTDGVPDISSLPTPTDLPPAVTGPLDAA